MDEEAGDDDASAQTANVPDGSLGLILGTFNDGTDRDVYSVTIPDSGGTM